MTSRSRHLTNKDGCKQQHALHLAKEAEKKEELKQRNMAFFQPRPAARGSRDTAVGPPEAQPSKGANLGKQGAQNSDLGSVSGLLESMVQYFDGKFSVLHKKMGLQERQMGVMATEVQQMRQIIGRLEQNSQAVQQEPTPKPQPASFRSARTCEDLLKCFPCLRKSGDCMWCSVCAESPQNGLLLDADQLPKHGNWDTRQPFSDLKASILRHMPGVRAQSRLH